MTVDDAFRQMMRREPQPSAGAPEASQKGGAEPLTLEAISPRPRFEYADVEKRSQVAEEYRILRTRLQVARPRRNSVLVTSCRHGEGKTTTAVNLALSMAQRPRQHVLVLDLDLRRPRIGRMLGVEAEVDLVDVVRGRASPEQAIVYGEQENLYALTARRQYANATELIETPAMQQLLDRLHATFDFLVVDVCPCLSTADPMVVGPWCGGVVMVVRTRHTQRESLDHAIRALREHEVPTLGVVLTFMKYLIPPYLYRYQYYHDPSYYYYRYDTRGRAEEAQAHG